MIRNRLRLTAPALPWVVAVAVVLGAWFTLWFHEYEPDLDAMGLFNAAYTALKTGHTTYPIYAYPGEMVVHPPTHYWILAQILRITGLSVQAGALIPVMFWVAVAALVTASSRWRASVKIGVLFAIWLGIVVWPPPNFVRPDIHVAAAWVVGLIALETGRVGGWRLWRLALGSFALALASMLHYPASLAVAGLLVYLAAAARALAGRARIRALLALAVPAATMLLLYLFIFVLPHYADIKYVTSHQNAQGHGTFAALDQTRQAYHFFAHAHLGGPVITTLMWPFLAWGIPAALVGPTVLLLFRETRLLALAAVPYLFTLLFYAREKTYFYYAPDIFIYFAAFGVVAAHALEYISVRGRAPRTATLAATCVLAVAVGAVAEPSLARWGTFRWHPLHSDMEVARAAGTKLIGPRATVLTNDLALWYVTGANRVYYPRDFDESLDLSGANIDRYLSQFGAVVEESYDSWTTGNAQHQNITTFLLAGRLHINGFYFGRSWTRNTPTIVRYFVLGAKAKPMRGYAWDGSAVSRFAESPTGGWSMIRASCPTSSQPIANDDWQTALYLPGAADYTLTITRDVRIGLIRPGQLAAARATLAAGGCGPVAVVARLARLGSQPVRPFLAAWRRTPRAHTVMEFPQAEADATSTLFAPTRPTRVVGTVDLSKASGFGSTPTTHSGSTILLRSAAAQFSALFQTPLPVPGTPDAWIKVRLRVLDGLAAVCSQDTTKTGCLGRINISPGPARTLYLRIGRAYEHPGLYVDNRGSASSLVEISSVQVVTAR